MDVGEKPHFIFAVLNARAEPLKESDHIKNMVMFEANIVDDSKAANEIWGIFDQNDWWRAGTQEGRLSRIHLDRFLNYWMVMTLAKEVTADHVSAAFNEYVEKSPLSMDEIAKSIRAAGQVYKDLEEARLPGIEVFLRRMKAMEVGVVMPPLLWLYTREIPEEKRRRGIQAIESYLVRRMLCSVASMGLNKLFVDLLGKLEASEVETIDQTIIKDLKDQTVDNRIWPGDRMVYDHLVGVPLRGTVGRQVMVLEALEKKLHSSMTEEFGQLSLTREHIMPQDWGRNWPIPEDIVDKEEARNTRNDVVKEIGNLTLVNGSLNPSLSNNAWKQKRETLEKHTVLRLNWELVHDGPDEWNEEAIHARSEKLAGLVVQVWPFADKL